jgi:nicotinate-nucleotide adenylyltransferase
MKVALFGGSFNPIHLAHLIIAERVGDSLTLDRVLFMPCAVPALKSGNELATGMHRLEMVRQAIAGNERFEVSDIELQRGGKSYTVETLAALKEQFMLQRSDLFLIIGGDNLQEFQAWRDPEEINRLCRIVVADRPGASYAGRVPGYVSDLIVIDTPLMYFSSTDIRSRIRESRSIRYLVPEAVERYIVRHKLYQL